MRVGEMAYAPFHSLIADQGNRVWVKGVDSISFERTSKYRMVVIRKTDGFIVKVRSAMRFEQAQLVPGDYEYLKLRPVLEVLT